MSCRINDEIECAFRVEVEKDPYLFQAAYHGHVRRLNP